MRHEPPEYNNYWLGSLRISAGLILVIATYGLVRSFLFHPSFGAQVLGWAVLFLTIVAASFLCTLGLAVVIKTAIRNATGG